MDSLNLSHLIDEILVFFQKNSIRKIKNDLYNKDKSMVINDINYLKIKVNKEIENFRMLLNRNIDADNKEKILIENIIDHCNEFLALLSDYIWIINNHNKSEYISNQNFYKIFKTSYISNFGRSFKDFNIKSNNIVNIMEEFDFDIDNKFEEIITKRKFEFYDNCNMVNFSNNINLFIRHKQKMINRFVLRDVFTTNNTL